MTEPQAAPSSEAGVYRIRLRGHLEPYWSAWFDGMAVAQDADGNTTLEGSIVDQAALYGLISRARDLGLTLLTVQRVEAGG
jgi:hypothetical protein